MKNLIAPASNPVFRTCTTSTLYNLGKIARKHVSRLLIVVSFVTAGFSNAYADCTLAANANSGDAAFLTFLAGCSGTLTIPNGVTLTINSSLTVTLTC